MSVFKEHPDKGRRIIEPIEFLREIVPAIFHHHEQYDGSGYSLGLKGNKFPSRPGFWRWPIPTTP